MIRLSLTMESRNWLVWTWSKYTFFERWLATKSLSVLANMPKLQTLNLRDTKISDKGLKSLVKLKGLKKLDLSECNSPGVSSDSGATFAQIPSLESLNLWATNFTDEGVKELATLSKLTWLNLDNTKVTDRGVQAIESMNQLTWIHLGKTKVTDGVVPSLLKLENLKYLDVSYTALTKDAFYELEDYFDPKGCKLIAP